jgi:hypothetical protein
MFFFCKNPHKKCLFCASVHVDIKNDYKTYMFTCLHVLCVHKISPNRRILCARKSCRHVDISYFVLSTNRPSGNGQIYGRQTDHRLYSNVTHFSKLTTFFCRRNFFPVEENPSKTEGKSIWGTSLFF